MSSIAEAPCHLGRTKRLSLVSANHYTGLATLAALLITSRLLHAADDPVRMCTALQGEMPDCRCATAFLTGHIGEKNAAILLRMWVLAAGGHPASTPSFPALYETYGTIGAAAAADAFLKVRNDFQVTCRPFEGMLTDDP